MTAHRGLLDNQQVSQKFQNSETGEQQEILIPNNQTVTLVVESGASDEIKIKYKLIEGGTTHVIVDSFSGTKQSVFSNKIYSIFLDIVTNSSNDITFELNSTDKK